GIEAGMVVGADAQGHVGACAAQAQLVAVVVLSWAGPQRRQPRGWVELEGLGIALRRLPPLAMPRMKTKISTSSATDPPSLGLGGSSKSRGSRLRSRSHGPPRAGGASLLRSLDRTAWSLLARSDSRGIEFAACPLDLLLALLLVAVGWAAAAPGRGRRGAGLIGVEVLGVGRGHALAELVEPPGRGEELAPDADVLEADALALARDHALAAPPPDAVGRGAAG